VLTRVRQGAIAASVLAVGAGPTPAEATAKHDDAGNTFEFAGMMLQEGGRFTGFGYVTFLRGLDAESLFGGAEPTEANARLTIFTVATLTSIARVNGVFVARAAGPLGVYLLDPAGANFMDPSSFRAGTLVASYDTEFQNTLTVIDPNEGIAHIVGGLTLRRNATFKLGDRRHRIGHRGQPLRLTAVGKGMRTNVEPPHATFDLGGYVTD
jgi:hypothetical protein